MIPARRWTAVGRMVGGVAVVRAGCQARSHRPAPVQSRRRLSRREQLGSAVWFGPALGGRANGTVKPVLARMRSASFRSSSIVDSSLRSNGGCRSPPRALTGSARDEHSRTGTRANRCSCSASRSPTARTEARRQACQRERGHPGVARRLPGVARGVDVTTAIGCGEAGRTRPLLDVIGERRQLLHDRMNSAADVGALEWCRRSCKRRVHLRARPRLHVQMVGSRRAEVSVAHEVGELVARASMHLDAAAAGLARRIRRAARRGRASDRDVLNALATWALGCPCFGDRLAKARRHSGAASLPGDKRPRIPFRVAVGENLGPWEALMLVRRHHEVCVLGAIDHRPAGPPAMTCEPSSSRCLGVLTRFERK